jgi:hypothetical protein
MGENPRDDKENENKLPPGVGQPRYPGDKPMHPGPADQPAPSDKDPAKKPGQEQRR